MDGKRYAIYRLTSPSGGCYVGMTAQSVSVRWGQHTRRAAAGVNHPLYNAIRKYGADSFTVECLEVLDGINEAEAAEIRHIADLEKSYNISEGGLYNGASGAKRLAELRKDPEWDAAYRARLSEGTKRSEAHASHAKMLADLALEWRKANPKAAYKSSLRALRLAAASDKNKRKAPRPWTEEQRAAQSQRLLEAFQNRPPSKKLRAKRMAKVRAEKQWAARDERKRQAIAEKISASITEHHGRKTPEERAAHNMQLADARSHIDHDFRKKRQKEALALYWTPERRAAFGAEVRRRRAQQQETTCEPMT